MSVSELYKLTEIELVYRTQSNFNDRHKVSTSKDAYELFKNNWDENKIEFIEQSKIILLNRANQVLGIYQVSSGGTSGTVVDSKQVFIAALKTNASGIILAHNHPSGNLNPSEVDLQLTNKLYKAGKYIDIEILDHLIITKENYYSFADAGRIGVPF